MAKRLRSDAVLGMGPEPIWVGEFNKTKLIDALNWYNYCYDQKKAKELIVSYCRHAKYDKKTIQHVKSIPDSKIILQVAWISRMLILGMVPDENTQKFFDDGLEKMLTYKGIRAKVVVKDTPKISVQDRILEKAREEAGEIEGLIDEYIASGCKLKYDLQKYFNGKNLSAVVLQRMCEMFIISSKEIAEAISGEDEQIKEAYSHFTKPQLKKLSEFYGDIVSTTNKTAIANKPTRKKRRVKEKPVTQIVSKVKFLEEHSGFKCVPIEKVVGADQVWTYNIKTKMLSVYNSDNAKGLTFKGTTLKNFNTKSSVGKRLRKPEVIIPELMSAGKVKIKKILPQLTTKEQGLTGRFNCDTIVLKIT
jgi:hypothetical protein